jgi:hypothetical protein
MVLRWLNFLESVKVKGLKKAVKSQDMFQEISENLRKNGVDFKKLLKKICKEWNIEGELKSYRSGSFGVTFLSDDKTLKITKSENEAQMISELINKKNDSITHIIKYFKVSKLKIKKATYYAILMEQIRPLEMEECSDVLRFYNECLEELLYSYSTEGGFSIEFEKIKRRILKEISKNEFHDFKGYVYDFIKILEDYDKLGMTNLDIHEGNLGLNDDGHLVSFDPMGDAVEGNKIKKLKL